MDGLEPLVPLELCKSCPYKNTLILQIDSSDAELAAAEGCAAAQHPKTSQQRIIRCQATRRGPAATCRDGVWRQAAHWQDERLHGKSAPTHPAHNGHPQQPGVPAPRHPMHPRCCRGCCSDERSCRTRLPCSACASHTPCTVPVAPASTPCTRPAHALPCPVGTLLQPAQAAQPGVGRLHEASRAGVGGGAPQRGRGRGRTVARR